MAYGSIGIDSINSSTGGLMTPSINSVNTFKFKNRIINGGMVIDQRNAGTEINPAVNNAYYLDRWQTLSTVASKFKIGQDAGAVTSPVGFIDYLGCTSLSAYTVGAAEIYSVRQHIEGYNTADLEWGTSAALPVTLSFWVCSSVTGTFSGALKNSDSSRSYPFNYTIDLANTWEQKSITIPGDTTGTWLTTNGIGITVTFSLGTGSTFNSAANTWATGDYTASTDAISIVGTNAATWYITGVQLEKGTAATSFDFRPYGTELQMCQRYYEPRTVYSYAKGAQYNSAAYAFVAQYSTKRAVPLITCTATFAAPRAHTTTVALLTATSPLDGATVFINAEL